MGRKPRIWNPNRFYHIVCRRNHREALFLDEGDFCTFLYILRYIYNKYQFEIPCYCLMTNHYHLMLRSKEQTISKIMSLVNKRFADYYNTRYNLNGHLFEKRYFSKEMTDDEGILEVSRYIHRNPLEAKMVKNLQDYKWSSFPIFMNPSLKAPTYMNVNIILRYYGGNPREKCWKYRDFCLEERDIGVVSVTSHT